MTAESNNNAGNGHNPAEGLEADSLSQLPLEEQISTLRDYLAEARREASQNLDTAQRAQAELANFRKRADDERISQGKYSNSRLITKLLPVIEELDLAVTHAQGEGPKNPWLQGVMLIQRKLLTLLESEGVSPIESVGSMFNPLEHEALGTEETSMYPPGYVTQAIRPGYRLHDRVIQPAQVMVAVDKQSTEGPEENIESTETQESGNG
jgi:molecular chaperone GrpE